MIRQRPPSPTSSNEHNDAGQPGRIKRSRAVLVCNRCKSLKTKCDLKRPCGNCVKSKVEDKCIYEPWRGRNGLPAPSSGMDGGPQDVATAAPGIAGPGPSTMHNRMSMVEDRLARIESSLTDKWTSLFDSQEMFTRGEPSDYSDEEQWQHLLNQLPPKDAAERLLERYFFADTLLRYSHAPSMLKHFHENYDKNASADCAPFMASITMALIIGCIMENNVQKMEVHQCREAASLLPTTLTPLYHRFLQLSEKLALSRSETSQRPDIQYYHVHAGLLSVERSMLDHSSSLPVVWSDLGKIYNTACLLGFHLDPSELQDVPTAYWSEMRRRLWWQLKIGQAIITHKLNLPTMLPQSSVQRPLLLPPEILHETVTQDVLNLRATPPFLPSSLAELTPPGHLTETHSVSEWTFVDLKISASEMIGEISKLQMKPPQPPSLENFGKITWLLGQFERQTPAHLSFNTLSSVQSRHSSLLGPNCPPWLVTQACVHNTGMTVVALSTYQPYLSLPLSTSTNADIVGMAFERSLTAAHRLIVSAEIFVWHVTIRWPEGKALFTWNMGSKIFHAGMTLALAAIQHDPSNPEWGGWTDDLVSAIGLMQVLVDHAARTLSNGTTNDTGKAKSKTADEKGLDVLRCLSDRAKSLPTRSRTEIPGASNIGPKEFADPYTGTDLPPTSRALDSQVTQNDRYLASLSTPTGPIRNYLVPPPPPIQTPTYPNFPIQTQSQAEPVLSDFGVKENFTLDDLEALLTEVYGTPGLS